MHSPDEHVVTGSLTAAPAAAVVTTGLAHAVREAGWRVDGPDQADAENGTSLFRRSVVSNRRTTGFRKALPTAAALYGGATFTAAPVRVFGPGLRWVLIRTHMHAAVFIRRVLVSLIHG